MILYAWTLDTTSNTFQKTAVIDSASSVIWVTRYNTAGQFELYLRASRDMLKYFYSGYNDILITRDDSDAVMIVDDIQLTTDFENGDYLTITGQDGGGILGRRVIGEQTNFTGTAENCIRNLIDKCIINPTIPERQISNFTLAAAQGYTDQISKQVTGKNLLETVSEICAKYGYGFRVTFDGTNFVFTLYKGVDRSQGQITNPPVIFSPDYENIGNTSFSFKKSGFRTAVYVAGEGEGSDRKIVYVSYALAGLQRRETWDDSRNTSSTTDGGELTPTEYRTILVEQGQETLRENLFALDFSGEILNVNSYQYGVDYGLGDTVTVKNQYGITGKTTVSEITEVEDAEGYRLIPTFSEWSV